MEAALSFSHFSDGSLTVELARLIHAERGVTARVVACIAEFDRRRLYLPQGFSSMFTYCRDNLHLGEGAAYRRIEAARVSRRFPEILELLASGAITLTNLVLIAHHLTEANRTEVLAEIRHTTKGQVEIIAARLKPKADVPVSIRKGVHRDPSRRSPNLRPPRRPCRDRDRAFRPCRVLSSPPLRRRDSNCRSR